MHYLSYNERKQHGSLEFPVDYYYITEEHPSYNMSFHWHKEWEIIRILQGEFILYIDGKECRAQKGDILLLMEGVLHGGVPQDCVYECLDFDLYGLFSNVFSVKDYLRPFYQNIFLPEVYYPNCQSDIYPIVNELLSAFHDNMPEDSQKLITLGNICRLFATLLAKHFYTKNTRAISAAATKTAQIKSVLEYIETHFSSPLSLEELSTIINMNPQYFCKFFKSITQQTPMNYVNFYRIEQASNMLCNTDKTVTAIGLECGFNDTCHFVKTFKKYKGITPKQYQKLNL